MQGICAPNQGTHTLAQLRGETQWQRFAIHMQIPVSFLHSWHNFQQKFMAQNSKFMAQNSKLLPLIWGGVKTLHRGKDW